MRRALLLGLFLSGCAAEGGRPASRGSDAMPDRIRPERGEVQPVELGVVEVAVALGANVGLHHHGADAEAPEIYEWGRTLVIPGPQLKEAAEEEIDRGGLTPSSPGFMTGASAPARPRYVFSGKVIDVRFDAFDGASGSFANANLSVEWTLFDREMRREIWRKATSGGAAGEGTSAAPLLEAFHRAARAAATDGELLDVLRVKPTALRSPLSGDLLPQTHKQRTTRSVEDQMWLAQESVVSLKTDKGFFSGFFVSGDGLIVTLSAPVQGQQETEVILKNGSKLSAAVVRFDPIADVALLRVSGRGFPALPLGSAEALEGGARLYMIANPAFSEGAEAVVRAHHRGPRIVGGRAYVQTDAARSDGSAGAPVLDSAGNVAAMMTQKSARQGSEALALAIPVELVRDELRVYAAGGVLPPAGAP